MHKNKTINKDLSRNPNNDNEYLEMFFNQSQDGFFIMILDKPIYWNDDIDKKELMDYVFSHQRVIKANKAFLNQYGYREEELLGLTPGDLFAHDLEQGKQIWTDFFDDGKIIINTDERKKDGSKMWIEGEYICLYDDEGRIVGHSGYQREVTQQIKEERQLKLSEVRLDSLMNKAGNGIVFENIDREIVYCNQAFCDFYGIESPELIEGKSIDQVNGEMKDLVKNSTEFLENLERIIKELKSIQGKKFELQNGTTLEGDFSPVLEGDELIGYLWTYRDITERIALEEKLRKNAKELKGATESQSLLLNNIDQHIWYLKSYDTYGHVNKAHANFYNLTCEQMENKNIYSFMPKEIATQCIKSNKAVFKSKKRVWTEEKFINLKGESLLFSIVKTPYIGEDGNVEYIICCATDITESKKNEEQLRHLSLNDSLTGLYNRNFFEEQLKIMNTKFPPSSVIVCDVDGLKIINDTLGHELGDQLLKINADILRKNLRKDDILARTGGDEFSVLLPDTTKNNSEQIVARIKESVNSYNFENPDLPLSISLGTATKMHANQSLKEILKKADDKMYHEKLIQKKSSRSQIIDSLMAALAEKDYITEGHSHRLSEHSIEIGEKLGLDSNTITNLNLLSQVHDLGKVGIPDNILFKKGPLSKEEWKIMKEHPEKGYRIAISSPDLAHIADLILKHHEKWDGTGYPLGLKKMRIPIECRILAVVDSYDAMTSQRPYNRPKSKSEAIEEIKKCSGTQFDPEIAALFIEILNNRD